ncbi:SET domain-containing protein [Wilcoxina mikolae CBS 423.85]|nr:SET domain-containing protein [Wilcoxina mikolae CBS 423.85]
MKIPQLPPSALPQYIHFQPITLNGLSPTHLGGSPIDLGISLIYTSSEHTPENPLLRVSPSQILSRSTIEAFSKSDRHLHDVLQVAGPLAHTPRGAIMAFLLLRMGTAAGVVAGERDGWSEYIQFLPRLVLLPTTYTLPERKLLTGTSLEPAVSSKLRALTQEFDSLQAAVPWATLQDWIQVDSLFRSRSLELPSHGTSLVPILDFANHAEDANAFFAVNDEGEATLGLRPGIPPLKDGDEVTIDYSGEDPKSAAELVFSYGFLPATLSSARSLTLPLSASDDDPLGRAKEAVWTTQRCVKIFETGNDSVDWEAGFVYLSVVNEEDGLFFHILQTMEGERKLQVLFKDEELDLGGNPRRLEELLRAGDMWEIFELRAVATLKELVEAQLLAVKDELEQEAAERATGVEGEEKDEDYRPQPLSVITALRELEETLMLKAVDMFEKQVLP